LADELLGLLGGMAAAWPVAARGQQSERMQRVGVINSLAADDPEGQLCARTGAGRIDGQDVRIDYRWAGGNADALRRRS
jgi:putative ABC transport system substrate-binding protein